MPNLSKICTMDTDKEAEDAQDNQEAVTEANVGDDEVYARWIYQPRFMNNEEVLNERFMSMRERNGNPNGPENGISGMLINRCDHDTVVEIGQQHKWKPKKNQPEEIFWGYGYAVVAEIRAVAEDKDVIDVEESPSETVPHHAIITFYIDGERQRGNTPHPRMRRYKDNLILLSAKL